MRCASTSAGAGGAVPVVLAGVIRTDASATEFGAMFTLAADVDSGGWRRA